jgi:hypothetical protein
MTEIECTECHCMVDESELCEYSESICLGCCDTCSGRDDV